MFRVLKLAYDDFAVISNSSSPHCRGDEFDICLFLYQMWNIPLNEINTALDDLLNKDCNIAEFGFNHTYIISFKRS